jgi:methylthioribose-1-phosphate isomerase
MKYMNVQGNPGLVRDKHTGAILNINKNEIKQAQKRKKLWQQEKEKTDSLASEVTDLKKDINEIKNLLKQVLEVKNGNHDD